MERTRVIMHSFAGCVGAWSHEGSGPGSPLIAQSSRPAPPLHTIAVAFARRYLPPVPNISYFPPERLEDPELRGYLEHAAKHGTPRPESQAIRAHVPAVLRSFSTNWDRVFRNGVLEHPVKELCRVYVSKTIECHY